MKNYHFHKRHLPHLYMPEKTYFVTFCLSQKSRHSVSIENEVILSQNDLIDFEFINKNKINTNLEENQNCEEFVSSILVKKEVAEIIVSVILFLNNKDYEIECYCIMPDHVHLVITLIQNSRLLGKILQSMKRYSAAKINKVLDRSGSLWQSESYDHIIRHEHELIRIIKYVLYNPVKAGLVDCWSKWEFTYLNPKYCRSDL